MKSSAKKIELASVDDLFSTEESRQDEQLEKIQEIPLSELHPFKDHPFKVKDDDAMIETADSIKKYGVLVPAIARPLPDGGYELVAGHRRRRASELAGKETMPVIVRDLDDDAATIIMVDSNLQRENLLPSERAFAYKMKLEAIKHQGARTDLTSVQVEQKLSARDQVAKEAGERSGIQVMRYVRLTELIPELLDMVDEKKIAFNPAYELSFLKPDEQQMLVETMDYEQAMQTINLKQYYPFCTEDTFVEVSDEIVEAFLLDKRAEAARERKMYRYKAFYSLDCNDGIENAAIGWAQPSPEDCLMEKEAQAEYAELLRRLYEAISSLPPTQARRVHARYMLGMKVKDIAAMEGITPSQAGKSIHAALRRLRRYFIRRKWTNGL